jgi:uncharacterized protein YeaO (DUF488 family)
MRQDVFMIRVKRIYDPPLAEDGVRILVDRLWPRGLSKDRAGVALWLKEVAPSTELRQWYHHEPDRWKEFLRKYWAELSARPDLVRTVEEQAARGTITLLYSSREGRRNNAVALRMFLEKRGGKK